MNEQREQEKKKVSTFGITTVIIPLVVVVIVIIAWFAFARQDSTSPETTDMPAPTAPR